MYEVEVDHLEYSVGADADEVAFINPELFKNSKYRSEQLVYEFTIGSQLTLSV